MAEEENVAKIQSTKSVNATTANSWEPTSDIENESSALPNVKDSTIYQADVVEGAADAAAEGEAITTEKPADAETAPADAGPVPAAADAAAPTEGESGAPAAEAGAEGGATAAPADTTAGAPPSSPAADAPTPSGEGAAAAEDGAPAAAPTDDGGGAGGQPGSAEGKRAESGTSPTGAAAATGQTTSPRAAPMTATSPGTPEPTKDPYAIEIPLDKKVNKRTQRKLWEEVERRKPLIPKHVAEHIRKYAKPPFETWGCKFRGKDSCAGCK